jgi:peptidyl-prolyl cis-trans isomerase B (cyclophilin B)
MKRFCIIAVLLVLTLTGCGANGNSVEEDVDLSALPYYSYLSDTNPVVTITVEGIGEMQLQLFPDVAKNTVDNFISYIQEESYSDSTFHRIIEDFMIQGGIISDTGCSIKGEFSSNDVTNDLSHYRGVISMARTSVKDSATSQFFIVHNNSSFLDGDYAGFGGLISGFNVLDDLASISTGYGDAPTEEVVIESITIELNGYTVDEVICAD